MQNDLIATVKATDADQPGTDNSRIEYKLEEQSKIGSSVPLAKEIFRMETNSRSSEVF